MKRTERFLVILPVVFIFFLACASGPKKSSEEISTGPFFEEGTGRSDMRLAITRPRGIGLGGEEEKYLDLIQSVLNSDFDKFSDIILSDRQNFEQIQQEQQLSMSGAFSDEDFVSIGQMTNSNYVLFGTLTRLDEGYSLFISITHTGTGEILCSYTGVSITEGSLRSLKGIRSASVSLLTDLGVKLTESGKKALLSFSEEEQNAQNALASSYEAERNGNFVTSLIYSYTAADADSGSAAAKKQTAAAFKLMGGSGAAIKDDYRQQQHWKKQLIEFESYYREHPPFRIVYTPLPVQEGTSDYDSRTAEFAFSIGLKNRREVTIMQKVLKDVTRELHKTAYKKNQWGFDSWPVISAESTKARQIRNQSFEGFQTFTIRAGLFNDRDQEIGFAEFPLYGQLVYNGGDVDSDSTQERRIIISNVDIDQITENMQIRIVSVNGRAVEGLEYITISAVGRMPLKEGITLAENKRLIPELPEETKARLAKEAKKEEKARKLNSMPLVSRFGFSVAALYNPMVSNPLDALAANFGMEFGYKYFTIEGWGTLPVRTVADSVKEQSIRTIGAGADLGFTYLWTHVLLSLEGGLAYIWLKNDSEILVPNFLLKCDFVPTRKLSIRLGYLVEFGSPSWSPNHGAYFNGDSSFRLGSLRILGRPMLGLVFWH